MKICDKCGVKLEVATEILSLTELHDNGDFSELMSRTTDVCPGCHELLIESIEKMWETFFEKIQEHTNLAEHQRKIMQAEAQYFKGDISCPSGRL